jgi:hypothetical protein
MRLIYIFSIKNDRSTRRIVVLTNAVVTGYVVACQLHRLGVSSTGAATASVEPSRARIDRREEGAQN